MKNYRLGIYYLSEILKENYDKKLTQTEMINSLKSEYDLEVSRKTLYNYLQDLQYAGLIDENNQYILKSELTRTELRFVIDAVMYARQIPEKESMNIVNKLKSNLSTEDAKRYNYSIYIKDIMHTENKEIAKWISIIEEAILKEKKIKTVNGHYDKGLNFVKEYESVLSPYYLTVSNGVYYLLCSSGRNDKLENRRLDRFKSVEILDERATKLADSYKNGKGFHYGSYINRKIYMFSGDDRVIKIRVKEKNLIYIIQQFGFSFTIIKSEGEYLDVMVMSNVESIFYWSIQYGDVIEVLEPLELRERIKSFSEDMLKKYKYSKYE